MDEFRYRDRELYCEDVPVSRIAAEAGTPVYIYSKATFTRHIRNIQNAFSELSPLICYSVKCCGNIQILRHFAELGVGFDVVSGGELYRVQQSGGSTAKVVYAGAGKTDREIHEAIEAEIAYFNIESEAELENLIRLAKEDRKTVHAALRVYPDVDPKTHRYTTTGKKETKFGVDIERAEAIFEQYGRNENVRLTAIHLHIGSPVNTVEPYVEALKKALDLIERLRGRGFAIEALDLGGGFGADYTTGQAPTTEAYAQAIVPLLRGKNLLLILEPGRTVAANAGILVTQVLYLKKGGEKNFAIIDAAMTDLIRPALYDSYHFIWPTLVKKGFEVELRTEPMKAEGLRKVDVVGPVC